MENASRCNVDLPQRAVEALRRHRKGQLEEDAKGERLRGSRSPTSPSPRDRSPLRSRLLVVLLVGLFSGGWVVVPLLMSPGPAQYTALLFLAIPVLGGLWIGTVWHGRHLKSYVILGLVAGILATLVSAAVAAYIRVSFLPVGVPLVEPEPFFGT